MGMVNKNEILTKAVERGIINLQKLSSKIEVMERQDYLNQHTAKIWRNKDGKFLTYVKDDDYSKGRRLIIKPTKKELDEWLYEYYKNKKDEPTVEQCFYRWVEEKLEYGEIKEVTYYKYIHNFNRFLKGTEIANTKVKNIDDLELEHFCKRAIHDQQLTSKGWADMRSVLNGAFKYAKRNRYTNFSISYFMGDMELGRNIFKKRKRLDEEQVFTEEEVEKLYDYVFHPGHEPTIRMLGVILAFQTGLRVGEISTLKYSDVRDDILYVHRTESKVMRNGKWDFVVDDSTKGKYGERKVVLTDAAKKTLRMARMMTMSCEYLFSDSKGKRIYGKEYSKCLYRLCDQVGIPRRSMHKARKTYATMLLDAGVSPRIVMNQMGHTMIETTEAYYHYNNKKVNEIKEVLTESLVI